MKNKRIACEVGAQNQKCVLVNNNSIVNNQHSKNCRAGRPLSTLTEDEKKTSKRERQRKYRKEQRNVGVQESVPQNVEISVAGTKVGVQESVPENVEISVVGKLPEMVLVDPCSLELDSNRSRTPTPVNTPHSNNCRAGRPSSTLTEDEKKVSKREKQRKYRQTKREAGIQESREAQYLQMHYEQECIKRVKVITTDEEKKASRKEQQRVCRQNAATNREHCYCGEISNETFSTVVPLDIGDMSVACCHCSAVSFVDEPGRTPNNCCHGGKVQLPPLTAYPKELEILREGTDETSRHFRQSIRSYNDAFAFASFNCTVPATDNRGPYVMKIMGNVSYMVSTSLENYDEKRARYGQVYIYDEQAQLAMRESNIRRANLLQIIGRVIIELNPYAAHYKMLNERYNGGETQAVLNFISLTTDDRRRYNKPTCGEMAAIIVSRDGTVSENVEVQVYPRQEQVVGYVPKSSHHVDPMTFPLLFPSGDLGWSYNMKKDGTNKTISPVQYYGYRLALRPGEAQNQLLRSGRLSQHYIIHAYLTIESQRLLYLRNNQTQLRVECYQGMTDHIANNSANTADQMRLGNIMILPSTFSGSPRYMQQQYQDTMAIARKIGRPDLFITFTCNPKWPELIRVIQSFPPNTTATDISTIVCRVFNIRLQHMLKEITSGSVFGKIKAYVYTIEFQKRGLPHAHILMTLDHQNKLLTPDAIDRFICAELPDKSKYPKLYENVVSHMLHGPHTSKVLCWNSEAQSCSKKFPKKLTSETEIIGCGYPKYRRRDNSTELHYYKNRMDGKLVRVNNSMVVPYNPYLLAKYNSHINVEYCASITSIKYIHKYINKGHDRARVQIEDTSSNEGIHKQNIDEIQDYVDSRYVGAMEAGWRIQELSSHGRSHAVIRLPVHLPGQQYATFEEGRETEALANNKKWKTALTAWFELNATDERASNITYTDTPDFFAFNVARKIWTRRKIACKVVGRITNVSPRDTERFHLKLILGRATNARCFRDLRVVNGKLYDTFRDAATAMGLTTTNDETFKIFDEAVSLLMPKRLRQFFVWYLLGEMPSDVIELWNKYKGALSEDFKDQHEYRAICAIEHLLCAEGRSGDEFGLPTPELLLPNEVCENTIPNIETFITKSKGLIEQLNDDQRIIYNTVVNSITTENNANINAVDKCFYIDGPGGTGKTFLYNAIYYTLRSLGIIVACVAWTGIAAILLPGGTTAHRLFGLPLDLPNEGTIFTNESMKNKLTKIDVIIWDECSMIPKRALELIDRTLQDISGKTIPFGGKTLILGGDFRQVLPVVKRAGKQQILRETIKYSPLWGLFVRFRLQRNMRANNDAVAFSKWLLDIGNGDTESLKPQNELKSKKLIDDLYPLNLPEEKIQNRAILAPQNAVVNQLNEEILLRVKGDILESRSIDHATLHGIDAADTTLDEQATLRYPTEYLNSLTPSGLPPHKLQLKVGAIVMLLRNLCVSDGLCNGTRMIVRTLHSRILIAELLTGEKHGEIVEIPRIKLDTRNDTEMPFILHRRQFPVRLAFAMTINKSQGQGFDYVGLYIDRPLFGHGQLYVALSRCRSKDGIKIQLPSDRDYIDNIVYKEIMN